MASGMSNCLWKSFGVDSGGLQGLKRVSYLVLDAP